MTTKEEVMRHSSYGQDEDGGVSYGYDYQRQCWIVDGIIEDCHHPSAMACGCYGRAHAGEAAWSAGW